MADYVVAVFYGRSLFAAGMESRLRSYPALAVTRVDAARSDAFQQLKDLQPEVVILDLSDTELGVHTAICKILTAMPNVLIIGLDSTSAELRIYRQERQAVKTSANLLQAISRLLAPESHQAACQPPESTGVASSRTVR